jgi:hypothetical protein
MTKKYNHQFNIRLNDEEVKAIEELNKLFFKGEGTYAMICRYLIKEAVRTNEGGK